MTERAIEQTFKLVEQLEKEAKARDPNFKRRAADYPVIATNVGIRSAGGMGQLYNLSPDTLARIHDREGVIGLIMAQHQLGRTWAKPRSRDLLYRHINAIHAVTKDYRACAIGTDIDGFIKPTLTGIKRAPDLKRLEQWIRADYDGDADAILYDNAMRVLDRACAWR